MPLGHYHQRRRRICGEVGEGAAHCGGPGGAIQIPDLGEDGVFDDHLPRCVQHSYAFCFGLEISSFELSNVLYIISVVNPYI